MDDVDCNERNTRLEECQFGGWDNENCGHYEDASAICEGKVTMQKIMILLCSSVELLF